VLLIRNLGMVMAARRLALAKREALRAELLAGDADATTPIRPLDRRGSRGHD
jgi:hypothetical protein